MKLQKIILQYKKLIIGLIIIVFIDFYVHYSGNALIYVDNSFGDEVFAAICTVAIMPTATVITPISANRFNPADRISAINLAV